MGQGLMYWKINGRPFVFLLCVTLLSIFLAGCGLFDLADPLLGDTSFKNFNHDSAWKIARTREVAAKYIGKTADEVRADWGTPHDVAKIDSVRTNMSWLRGESGGKWVPTPVDQSFAYRRIRSKELKGFPPEYDVRFYAKDDVVVWVDVL